MPSPQPNPKSIVDSAFNAAIMGSFCVPEEGPFIAAGLAGGQALFDIIYGVVDQTISPDQQVISTADLRQAILDIQGHVDKIAWQSDYQPHFDFIAALNEGILIAMSDDGAQVETTMLGGIASTILDADWAKALDQFNSYVTDPGSGLFLAAKFVEDRSSHEVDTIDLYCFTVGCFILACKMAQMVEYAQILHANDIAKARSDAAIDAAKKAVLVWKYADPATRGPQPSVPAAFDALLPEAEIKAHSVYVKAFRDRMKVFIDYIQGVIDKIGGAYDALDSKAAARATAVTLQIDGAGHHYYVDSQTGATSVATPSFALARSQRDIYVGSLEQSLWQALIGDPGYDAVPRAKIAQLKDLVACWTAGRNDAVNFLNQYGVK